MTGEKKFLALDPRTKVLIWLFTNVVVFSNAPRIFFTLTMALYALLFILAGKAGSMVKLLVGYAVVLLAQRFLLPLLPPAIATVFATVTYAVLIFPCVMGGMYIISTTSVSQLISAFRRMRVPENFTITMAVTLRYLPALREDVRHILDAMSLRQIKGLEQRLECIYIPILMGTAQTAEELSESAAARGIEYPGRKTSWHTVGFHVQDGIIAFLFLAVCVASFLCKGVLG